MKKLFVIGDLHFSSSRDWDIESFTKFLDWFESKDFGPFEDIELLSEGDITEKGINTGIPIDMATRFFVAAKNKFSKVYVLGGNHCHKYVNGESQYVSQYLPRISDRIEIILKPIVFPALGGAIQVKALPYMHVNTGTIERYYDEMPEDFRMAPCDILTGHVCIADPKIPMMEGIHLDKFAFKKAIFGHIHERYGINADYYTGSIMPFKKSEESTEKPRIIKIFNADLTEDEIAIPQFRHYVTIDFNTEKPEHKRYSNDFVTVYELNNVYNKQAVKELYKDYYIKFGSVKQLEVVSEKKTIVKQLFESNYEALQKMIADDNIKLKRKTLILLKKLLS